MAATQAVKTTTKIALFVGSSAVAFVGGALLGRAGRTRIGGLALAPPAPKAAPSHYDPWSREADRKRLARYFTEATADQVREIAPRSLPAHVKPYAEFMVRQSGREMGPRDVAKAYLLTVGSMRRAAIGADKVRARWPDYPGKRTGKVRPEDALGKLLTSEVGRCYLDSVARGKVNVACADEMAHRFGAWGFEPSFRKQLDQAASLAKQAPKINKMLRTSSRPGWYRFVKKSVPGVSIAKAGFFASLMGRGDMVTADARQIDFWTCPPASWNRKARKCKFPLSRQVDDVGRFVDEEYLKVLNQRMRELRMKMDPRFAPFREHLTHHAWWDAVGRSKTTHSPMITAMEAAR